ncbi:hypothetical protein DFJ74DRAFT_693508 [Hyaloraphidium curvatum]|nr:hypothetical protein DFJ74DRAFT_693508 [Hyaloraphidium curvatum]
MGGKGGGEQLEAQSLGYREIGQDEEVRVGGIASEKAQIVEEGESGRQRRWKGGVAVQRFPLLGWNRGEALGRPFHGRGEDLTDRGVRRVCHNRTTMGAGKRRARGRQVEVDGDLEDLLDDGIFVNLDRLLLLLGVRRSLFGLLCPGKGAFWLRQARQHASRDLQGAQLHLHGRSQPHTFPHGVQHVRQDPRVDAAEADQPLHRRHGRLEQRGVRRLHAQRRNRGREELRRQREQKRGQRVCRRRQRGGRSRRRQRGTQHHEGSFGALESK